MEMNISSPLGKEKKPISKVLDLLITFSISAVFFLCPIFFTGLTAQGFGFDKIIIFYLFVLVGAVAWVTKGVIEGELSVKRTPLDIAILVLLIIFSISTFFSVNVRDSLLGSYGDTAKGLIAVFSFCLFYYLVVNNINTKRLKIFFFSFAASAFVLSAYVLLQLNGKYILPIDWTKQPSFNPLGSLTTLSAFLMMALPILIIGASQLDNILPKAKKAVRLGIQIAMGLGILSVLANLFMLKGFVSYPIAILGVVILLMFFLSKIIDIKTDKLLIPLASFFLLIVFLVIGNFDLLKLDLPTEVGLSRSVSWKISKASLSENPLFGSGPSTFYYDFSKFKNQDFNLTPLWNAKFNSTNGYLFELASTVGSLGVLAFVVIILIMTSIIFLTLIKTKDKDNQPILLALFSSVAMMIVYGLLFSVSNSLIICFVLIGVLAMSVAVCIYPDNFRSLKLSFKASPNYALALSFIFLAVSFAVAVLFTMGLKMYIADYYARKAYVADNNQAKIENMEKAISMFKYEDTYHMELANYYMQVANENFSAENKDQALIQKGLNTAFAEGREAMQLSPNKASLVESMALLYENASFYTKGALDLSEDSYKKLAELDPNSPIPDLRIALINMARANAEEDEEEQKYYINEAISYYEKAIEKKGDLSSAYYGKAVAYEKIGDVDQAIDQLKSAVIVDNNINYYFELGRLYFNRGVIDPTIAQTATEELTGEEETDPGMSVEAGEGSENETELNEDLKAAEQIFLSIYQFNPNHANSLYSLAILYQKTNRLEEAKAAAEALLEMLDNEQEKEVIKKQFADLL